MMVDIIYATTEIEFDIVRNNFSDSSATSGDGDVIFLNQRHINMTDIFVDTSVSGMSGNNSRFLHPYGKNILLNSVIHILQALMVVMQSSLTCTVIKSTRLVLSKSDVFYIVICIKSSSSYRNTF